MWEREAAAYDEAAVLAKKAEALKGSAPVTRSGCPGSQSQTLRHPAAPAAAPEPGAAVSAHAVAGTDQAAAGGGPYFNGAKLLIAADCTAYSRADFHQRFMRGHITLIGCPKLDEGDYTEKADGDHPAQRYPGSHRGPHGGSLLRRHPAGGGDRPASERQVHSPAGGNTGPGWKYSGLMQRSAIK